MCFGMNKKCQSIYLNGYDTNKVYFLLSKNDSSH